MDTLDAARTQVRTRIAALRAALARHGLAAWVVPSSDPHLSEYLPERWQARVWLSGFDGSAGLLLVTADHAAVWADSRYWVQAEAQLAGTGIELQKMGAASSTGWADWLAEHMAAGTTVGADGAVLGLATHKMLADKLAARGVALRTDLDLMDEVWTPRPELPAAAIYEHAIAPTPRAEKLAAVRAEMKTAGCAAHFISTLDDIAWLFNLRGADVPFNPVFIAHALITEGDASLFVGAGKVPAELAARLAADGVTLAPYAQARVALANRPAGSRILLDPKRVTLGLRQALPAGVTVVEAINPSTLLKSRKTAAEAAHIRAAMEQDGAALAEFFAWFDDAIAANEPITELTIDEKIGAARARREGFVSPSFATIAGFNANGALPHYRATEEAHSAIVGDGMLLIDSGGQYFTGTTDITRVVPVRQASAAMKSDYTRVLKGMINLSLAVFPRGTRSPTLDALARAPIWAGGIDYGHGTGHGVGYFLNVHEGPHGITPYLAPEPQTAMEPGMITSNEPGIYRPGRWGVRIENLVINVPAQTTEFGEFLQFETLTLCPIDTRLIDLSLMRADELEWLNAYHAEVARRVGPLVTGRAAEWLAERTRAI
ncbi:MAG: aminopeptidase P family protein [Burkholderiaceae bacterium]